MVKRCYLCNEAIELVEHPDQFRKYYYLCMVDDAEHEPCDSCEYFEEARRREENGGTHSLEKRI